jgi:hypothetical protein
LGPFIKASRSMLTLVPLASLDRLTGCMSVRPPVKGLVVRPPVNYRTSLILWVIQSARVVHIFIFLPHLLLEQFLISEA